MIASPYPLFKVKCSHGVTIHAFAENIADAVRKVTEEAHENHGAYVEVESVELIAQIVLK